MRPIVKTGLYEEVIRMPHVTRRPFMTVGGQQMTSWEENLGACVIRHQVQLTNNEGYLVSWDFQVLSVTKDEEFPRFPINHWIETRGFISEAYKRLCEEFPYDAIS